MPKIVNYYIKVAFERIPFDLELPAKVVKDLSTDQKLRYSYCKGVSSGAVDGKMAPRKIG